MMVRTQSQVSSRPLGIDPSRVLAMSTAVALHLLAGGLLLIPLSHRAIPQQTAPKERWLMPVSIPTPPPPLAFPVEVTFTPKTHSPTKTLQAPVQTPVVTETSLVDSAPSAVAATVSDVVADSTPTTTTDPSGPIEAGQLQYLSSPAPSYPAAALRAGQQGTVLLRVLVGTDGRPAEVSVQTSSGHRMLDLAARSQVLRNWRFQPAMQNGQAVQAYGLVPVSFSLN
ncbi:energy transducer TonB [Xanthomonas citri pv. fuscans]|uniref:Energy transducer TonB n=1 Tax=Xanthomonas citri pv. fuscans TaxID=366649 RepID=A0AB34QEH9_XANCI|nr:energy transducer TonB [Xanthomonas citri]KGP27053.1 energy transducer TonB [Xanthomonas phaseoli pv. phaseoli]AZU17196.1 energy transducer TonB [Xanthomonas citri pv. fuscans]AZU21275.1 energy transducer TonB [Xanthomonas citri pv. fuscans]AZU92458.1 energy transducer TonB [Xanthomonas citri pv. fuscans]KGK66902.1 energy transducer TonB [Xanthomonas citri pv. fuscans]